MSNGRAWGIDEEKKFINEYPHITLNELRVKFNRTTQAINNKAYMLGLKKAYPKDVGKSYQSYVVKLYKSNGDIFLKQTFKPTKNAKAYAKRMIKKWLGKYSENILIGEYYYSITHGFECY